MADLAAGLRAEAHTFTVMRGKDQGRWDKWTRRIDALERAADLLDASVSD